MKRIFDNVSTLCVPVLWERRLAAHVWLVCAGVLLVGPSHLCGQDEEPSRQQLQSQVNSMQSQLENAQRQIAEDHAELQELRREIEALKKQSPPDPSAATPTIDAQVTDLQQAVADLQERQAIHQAEIQVHEQEKLESASKYAVKLHGLVLFNSAVNNGALDQPTLPALAVPPGDGAANGSLTATGRQTLVGLDATGPSIWGARTYASLEMDFAAGLSPGEYAGGGNLFRLRTAGMQFAWPSTTVQAGIAPLILTPSYPTSYFSIGYPAMSWSGALWSWLPQLSVDRRLNVSDRQQLHLQAAVADIPDAGTSAVSGLGAVSAAERSRYPGTEARASWQWGARLPVTLGVGGYLSPHSYPASSNGAGASFNAWARTVDWNLSLPARLQLSGFFYTGAALGGLSAGAFKDSILLYGQPHLAGSEQLTGLKDAGGWSQLKFKAAERVEFNFAFGQDNAASGQLRRADLDITNAYVGLARNQTAFGNVVFRPTSTILLSAEYRKLRSWQITGAADTADILGLAAGYEF